MLPHTGTKTPSTEDAGSERGTEKVSVQGEAPGNSVISIRVF